MFWGFFCWDVQKQIVLGPLCELYYICCFNDSSQIDDLTLNFFAGCLITKCWLISFSHCAVLMIITVNIFCAKILNLLIFVIPICVFSLSFGTCFFTSMGVLCFCPVNSDSIVLLCCFVLGVFWGVPFFYFVLLKLQFFAILILKIVMNRLSTQLILNHCT